MQVHHPDIQLAADAATLFCCNWAAAKKGKRLLVIQGVSGCGKTHIAKRVSRWAQMVSMQPEVKAQNGPSEFATSRFLDWSPICSPERLDEKGWLILLDEIARDSMVTLDDIGSEVDRFRSGASTERLCMLLNRRAGKFTLITTNHPPESWVEVWDARVSDRLLRDSQVVTMEAPSFTTIA